MPGMDHDAAGHPGSGHQHASTGGGLTDVQEGFRLTDVAGPAAPGRPETLSFRILDPSGAPQTRFEVEQTKLMHVYVVRTDLTDFYHLHPTMTPDGRWSVPLTLNRPGPYRVVTEFVAVTGDGMQRPFVLGSDLAVPGAFQPEQLPAPSREATADGYTVTVDADPAAGQEGPLKLRITRDGAPVTNLEPYLDTYAHLTAFHDGDLEAVHLHPIGGVPPADARGGPDLTADAEFSSPGAYRLFVQFQTDSVVRTVPITLAVR